VLIAGIVGYVALLFLKSRLSQMVKIAAAVIGLVIIAGMLYFDAKFWGVVLMGTSTMILAALPWLDHSPVKSIRYRPGWHLAVYLAFFAVFLILGYLGVQPPDDVKNLIAKICTFLYFAFFLLMPWWSTMGTFKPVPNRVTFHPH